MFGVTRNLGFTLLAGCLLFFACGAPPELPSGTLQLIGSASPNGNKVCQGAGACLQFPVGAVSKEASISARIVKEQNDEKLGPVYEFEADTKKFEKDIELILPVAAELQKEELVVAFLQDGKWIPVPTTIGSDGATRIGKTNHLSQWTLRRKPHGCQADSDCAAGKTCVSGVCKAKGSCTPSTEVCDGIDNDCDGLVDENAPCPTGQSCHAGQCRTSEPPPRDTHDGGPADVPNPDKKTPCASSSDCMAGQTCVAGLCQVGGCTPSAEICDGIDNDCDGLVDEGCTQRCASDADCPRGQACVAGVCKAKGSCTPSTEICDGIDNDCDGVVDENAPCPAGQSCHAGQCRTSEPPPRDTHDGGPADVPNPDKKMPCASNSDCMAGQTCVAGLCTL